MNAEQILKEFNKISNYLEVKPENDFLQREFKFIDSLTVKQSREYYYLIEKLCEKFNKQKLELILFVLSQSS